MPNVSVDQKKILELVERGVEQVLPSREQLVARLSSGQKLKLYCGFDPTAPALHIGHAIMLNKLRQFQDLGHEVIFLIGDFTGLIGDPTDKKAVRRQLSQEEITANARDYQRQAAAFLRFDGDNPAKVFFNSEWNAQLSLADIISLATNFTVQQMIQRDMFQARLKDEKAIYLHEFMYPLIQAYDSVAMEVDLEVGGNDQMFNMMCGRHLLKSLKNKDKFVMTMKLLSGGNGKKMSKSEGNAVFLNAQPAEIYGQVMSWPDEVIIPAFELCTRQPAEEIVKMSAALAAGQNPRDYKAQLAREITMIIHGAEAAEKAQAEFVSTFKNKDVPDNLPSWQARQEQYNLVDLLVECGLSSSKTEARRLIKEGAIRFMSPEGVENVADEEQIVIIKESRVIARGKRRFIKILAV